MDLEENGGKGVATDMAQERDKLRAVSHRDP
jgi:hypothetical protein